MCLRCPSKGNADGLRAHHADERDIPPFGKLVFRLSSVKKRMRQIPDGSPSKPTKTPCRSVPLDAATSGRDYPSRQGGGCNGTSAPAV